MTSETQTFISPAEIKALRIECQACHVKTTVLLDSEQSAQRAIDICTRFQCGHCHSEWFTVKESSYVESVARFVKILFEMQRRGDDKRLVTFEIATPESK